MHPMVPSTISLLAVALLTACSASSGEPVGSSSAAIEPLAFCNLSVTPTDTQISIAYAVAGPALAVTLGSQTQTATLANSATATQNQFVTFTGLSPCTSYAWSIPSPNGTVSGQTNTRYTGNTVCPATESILADGIWKFEGLEHQEEQNIGCRGWASDWPVGSGWRLYQDLSGPGYDEGQFGFVHYSNNSSFCAESTVHVWRTELFYDFTPLQMARGIADATFTADYSTLGTPPFGRACSPQIFSLDRQVWGQNAQGPAWYSFLGGAETNDAIAIWQGDWALAIGASADGKLVAPYGKPQGTRVVAGFAAPHDGFAELENGFTQSWAADNDQCVTGFRNAAVTLTYESMPPETPICSAYIDCTTANVTCQSTPEVFQLFAGSGTSGRLVGTFDATGGASPSFVDSSSSLDATYTACTLSSAGVAECAPVALTGGAGCPTPPPPPPPTPTSIAVETSPFWSGTTAMAVLTVSEALSSETFVLLSTSDPLGQGRATGVTVPERAVVPAGQTSATFPITASSTALSSVVVTASIAGSGAYAIDAPIATGPFVMKDSSSGLEVWFRDPAPSGSVMTFTSSNTASVMPPASLAIPAGSTTAAIDLTLGVAGRATITATYAGVSQAVTVFNLPPPPHVTPPKCVGLCQ